MMIMVLYGDGGGHLGVDFDEYLLSIRGDDEERGRRARSKSQSTNVGKCLSSLRLSTWLTGNTK